MEQTALEARLLQAPFVQW